MRRSSFRSSSMVSSLDFRENGVSDSPPDSKPAPHSAASLSPSSRPSAGSLSPQNVGPRTPSPQSAAVVSAAQQLPPACGARQLSKLKRFLTTLQQFGADISPDIGDRVRTLVLALVNSHLSIEEFHAKLQESTNFPLRPFVIPFLKANLPLLQQELLHCARIAKQTPAQYLAHNEHVLFDPTHSPLESKPDDAVVENGKRKSPDSQRNSKENGEEPTPSKRHCASSPGSSSSGILPPRISPFPVHAAASGAPIRLEDISLSRDLREGRDRTEREARERHFAGYGINNYHPRLEHMDAIERLDDDWKHVETMLHCITGMVEKTRRALSVLQERTARDREEMAALALRSRHEDGKKLRFDERYSDVKRRAEEALQEVKRQAMAELQKAVTATEQKAQERIVSERGKMQRLLAETRRQVQEEMLSQQQSDSTENCWNCGRKANETCSGCNVARYCGSFCQHKDWESHHHVCGQPQQQSRDSPKVAKSLQGTSPVPKTCVDIKPNPADNCDAEQKPSTTALSSPEQKECSPSESRESA